MSRCTELPRLGPATPCERTTSAVWPPRRRHPPFIMRTNSRWSNLWLTGHGSGVLRNRLNVPTALLPSSTTASIFASLFQHTRMNGIPPRPHIAHTQDHIRHRLCPHFYQDLSPERPLLPGYPHEFLHPSPPTRHLSFPSHALSRTGYV